LPGRKPESTDAPHKEGALDQAETGLTEIGLTETGPLADAPLEPAVVAELYVRHADELRWFLRGLLRDTHLANDVLQATFARAVEVGHTARRESVKGWLFRVAYNEAMLLRRRAAAGQRAIDKLGWAGKQPDDSPEEHLVRWESVARVRAELEQLPAEQQQIVRMRIYEQKTFAQISAELNIPLGTALSRMRAALQKLKRKMTNQTEKGK